MMLCETESLILGNVFSWLLGVVLWMALQTQQLDWDYFMILMVLQQ